MTDEAVMQTLIDLCVRLRKKLVDLSDADVATCPLAKCAVTRSGKSIEQLAATVKASLIAKIEHGCRSIENTKFLHAEPHHDDIMLGYLPSVLRHTRVASNEHHFVCGTSGFNSVSNPHMFMLLERVEKFLTSGTWTRLCSD